MSERMTSSGGDDAGLKTPDALNEPSPSTRKAVIRRPGKPHIRPKIQHEEISKSDEEEVIEEGPVPQAPENAPDFERMRTELTKETDELRKRFKELPFEVASRLQHKWFNDAQFGDENQGALNVYGYLFEQVWPDVAFKQGNRTDNNYKTALETAYFELAVMEKDVDEANTQTASSGSEPQPKAASLNGAARKPEAGPNPLAQKYAELLAKIADIKSAFSALSEEDRKRIADAGHLPEGDDHVARLDQFLASEFFAAPADESETEKRRIDNALYELGRFIDALNKVKAESTPPSGEPAAAPKTEAATPKEDPEVTAQRFAESMKGLSERMKTLSADQRAEVIKMFATLPVVSGVNAQRFIDDPSLSKGKIAELIAMRIRPTDEKARAEVMSQIEDFLNVASKIISVAEARGVTKGEELEPLLAKAQTLGEAIDILNTAKQVKLVEGITGSDMAEELMRQRQNGPKFLGEYLALATSKNIESAEALADAALTETELKSASKFMALNNFPPALKEPLLKLIRNEIINLARQAFEAKQNIEKSKAAPVPPEAPKPQERPVSIETEKWEQMGAAKKVAEVGRLPKALPETVELNKNKHEREAWLRETYSVRAKENDAKDAAELERLRVEMVKERSERGTWQKIRGIFGKEAKGVVAEAYEAKQTALVNEGFARGQARINDRVEFLKSLPEAERTKYLDRLLKREKSAEKGTEATIETYQKRMEQDLRGRTLLKMVTNERRAAQEAMDAIPSGKALATVKKAAAWYGRRHFVTKLAIGTVGGAAVGTAAVFTGGLLFGASAATAGAAALGVGQRRLLFGGITGGTVMATATTLNKMGFGKGFERRAHTKAAKELQSSRENSAGFYDTAEAIKQQKALQKAESIEKWGKRKSFGSKAAVGGAVGFVTGAGVFKGAEAMVGVPLSIETNGMLGSERIGNQESGLSKATTAEQGRGRIVDQLAQDRKDRWQKPDRDLHHGTQGILQNAKDQGYDPENYRSVPVKEPSILTDERYKKYQSTESGPAPDRSKFGKTILKAESEDWKGNLKARNAGLDEIVKARNAGVPSAADKAVDRLMERSRFEAAKSYPGPGMLDETSGAPQPPLSYSGPGMLDETSSKPDFSRAVSNETVNSATPALDRLRSLGLDPKKPSAIFGTFADGRNFEWSGTTIHHDLGNAATLHFAGVDGSKINIFADNPSENLSPDRMNFMAEIIEPNGDKKVIIASSVAELKRELAAYFGLPVASPELGVQLPEYPPQFSPELKASMPDRRMTLEPVEAIPSKGKIAKIELARPHGKANTVWELASESLKDKYPNLSPMQRYSMVGNIVQYLENLEDTTEGQKTLEGMGFKGKNGGAIDIDSIRKDAKLSLALPEEKFKQWYRRALSLNEAEQTSVVEPRVRSAPEPIARPRTEIVEPAPLPYVASADEIRRAQVEDATNSVKATANEKIPMQAKARVSDLIGDHFPEQKHTYTRLFKDTPAEEFLNRVRFTKGGTESISWGEVTESQKLAHAISELAKERGVDPSQLRSSVKGLNITVDEFLQKLASQPTALTREGGGVIPPSSRSVRATAMFETGPLTEPAVPGSNEELRRLAEEMQEKATTANKIAGRVSAQLSALEQDLKAMQATTPDGETVQSESSKPRLSKGDQRAQELADQMIAEAKAREARIDALAKSMIDEVPKREARLEEIRKMLREAGGDAKAEARIMDQYADHPKKPSADYTMRIPFLGEVGLWGKAPEASLAPKTEVESVLKLNFETRKDYRYYERNIKNRTVAGLFQGQPIEGKWGDKLYKTFTDLALKNGVTADTLPEVKANETVGQYLERIAKLK